MPHPDVPTMDLFAGAGGLSLGLAGAGLRPVVTAERDKDALSTYIAAHRAFMGGGDLDVREGDIGAHSFRALRGEVAVIAGGPPCQPYSLGGARRGALDERDGIPQFVRVVEEVRPRAFIMENVPGLARGRQADVLRSTLIAFEGLGYYVSWRVLHAADFGVAQRRQRLFLVGSRDATFVWPVQTHGAGADRPWVRARDVLDPHQIVGVPNTAKVTYARVPDLRPSPYDGHLWNGGGRPINPDGQVPTLLASMGGNKTPWLDTLNLVPEYHSTLLAGGPPRSGEVPGARRISVDEAAIVQGFPVNMPWSGPTSSRYRQIGNAVPVQLAEAVGRAVVEHLGIEGVSQSAPRLVA